MAAKETMQDARSMTVDQLQTSIMNLRKEQMNLRFQKATGQMENPNRWRAVRVAMARFKLAQSELKLKTKETK